jgi:Tol biopolymer transport system component/DNA-binding winged helix-turn-helix (wHTH) protein
MAEAVPDSDRLRLVDIEIDLRTGELWKDNVRAVLSEQPFRILVMLVGARGALVSRDDLRRALWPEDTFVDFEHGLNAAVKRLREALGDSASAPRFIETIPRRGYRLVATPVSVRSLADEPPIPPAVPGAGIPAVSALSRWVALVLIAIAFAALVAGVRSGLTASSTRAASSHPELSRLTSTSGLNIDPALSADGRLLAYASDRDEGSGLDIWMQPVDGGPATRLTGEEGDEAEPSFSPDGASVVYARRETGGIYVVGARGGDSRTVVRASRARMPRFSPDGRQILYWTGMPVWTVADDVPYAGSSIHVVSADGGEPRGLAADFASARFGVWAPDGGHVLFLGSREADAASLDFYVTSLSGNAVRTGVLAALRSTGFEGIPYPGAWDPDGSVYFTGSSENSSNVWKVRIDAATGVPGGVPERVTFGTAMERSPSVATGRVVFASLVQNVDVWRVPLDPHAGIAVGPLERLTRGPTRDRLMNVSKNGRTMAYVSSQNGRDSDRVRDLASGRDLEVGEAATFRISSDGTVAAITRTGQHRIDIVPVGGGSATPLCDRCNHVGWAVDGSRLVMTKERQSRLFIRDVATGSERLLTSHPDWKLQQPRISPDGRWVTFHTSNSPTLRQIYIVPATSDGAIRVEDWIPAVSDFGIQPSWSEDGRSIYYFSNRDGAFCAWLQPLGPTMRPTGEPRAVAHFHEPRLGAVVGAYVTNDVQARYLFATLTETFGNIWLIDQSRSPDR